MDDELALVARAITDKVTRQPGMVYQPGTVVAYEPNTPLSGGIADVRMDGDSDTTLVSATNLLGRVLVPDDRVMVVYVPPQAAYVVGFAGRPQAGAGQEFGWMEPGPIYGLPVGGPWLPAADGTLTVVRARLLTASASDVELEVTDETAATLATITITAGDTTTQTTEPNVAVSGDGYLVPQVTSNPSEDGADLVVQAQVGG